MNLNIYISIICLKTKKNVYSTERQGGKNKKKRKGNFQLFIDERERNKRRKKAVLNRWIGDR